MLKFAALTSLLAVLALGALLVFHASFDPYGYLGQTGDKLASRDAWLARRELYVYALAAAGAGLVISCGSLVAQRWASR